MVFLGRGGPSGRRAEARRPEGPPHSRKANGKSTPGPRPDPGRRRGGVQKSGPHFDKKTHAVATSLLLEKAWLHSEPEA